MSLIVSNIADTVHYWGTLRILERPHFVRVPEPLVTVLLTLLSMS